MKYKKAVLLLLAVTFLLGASYVLFGNAVVRANNKKLNRSMTSIAGNCVKLNELVPFDWEAVYTFAPYTSKQEIEKTIGFKSAFIQTNHISEGMVHLLFVSKNKVVASVLGYEENLGYRLDFTEKVSFADEAVFDVTNASGVKVLSCTKEVSCR